MEVLEKMLASLESATVEYIITCFVSHDPNFSLEPVEKGIQAVSEEDVSAVRELVHDQAHTVAADLDIGRNLPPVMPVAATAGNPEAADDASDAGGEDDDDDGMLDQTRLNWGIQ
ncbi:hypothetical protein E2562_033477, partial [Oryza meyeriana var. granulata]